MKIHEYNEMMAYLTRPAAPIRQPVVQGGVIGQDMGYRTGFSKYKRTWDELRKLTPEELAKEGFFGKKRTRNEKGNSVVTKEFKEWIDKERAKPEDPNAPKKGISQKASSEDQIKRIKEIYTRKIWYESF